VVIGHSLKFRYNVCQSLFGFKQPMAQILIDIPDALAEQLTPFQSQFSELFTRLVATPLLGQSPCALPLDKTVGTYQEILDFLVSRPTPEQIISFKISEASQNRLQVLLQKNRELNLTNAETSELDLSEQIDILMGFLKVRAYAALKNNLQA
jgi:hypothetical protein